MKKYFLTAAIFAACAFSGGAIASDSRSAQLFNWTGFYVGGNVGAIWWQNKWFDTDHQVVISKDRTNGLAGGLQVGYDWQFAPTWVVGIRGIFDWTGVHTDVGQDISCSACGLVDHSKLNSFQTLTGRLGYLAQPNLMIYAKGGVAWAQDHYWQTETIPAFSVVAQLSTTRTGYDVGGGFEWMFAPGWSSFVEYDYANFGSGSPADSEAKITQDLQMVLVGMNYRFGGR